MALPKIKAAWTIPEDFLKETVDLKTILVVIIERTGKVEPEPLPPIPKELSEDILEIGIHFVPD